MHSLWGEIHRPQRCPSLQQRLSASALSSANVTDTGVTKQAPRSFTAVDGDGTTQGERMKCRSRRSYASFMVAENRNPICRRTHDREHRARRRPRAWDDGEGRSREHQKTRDRGRHIKSAALCGFSGISCRQGRTAQHAYATALLLLDAEATPPPRRKPSARLL